ncbi:MAG: 6-bladed beta-propeller [Acidobacteria bacterium]|nr:6-bladed beta-propeller [Acidobacteriota bacterium]
MQTRRHRDVVGAHAATLGGPPAVRCGATAVACALLVGLSCAPGDSVEEVSGPVIERETVDGIEVVRNVSGSVWEQPKYAVEELRIGTLEGPDETMFGRIGQIAPDGSGGVFLFDGQVPAIRNFDGQGNYLGQVGGRGEGPGEYQDALLGMQVRADGRLQVWDPRNGRITVYAADGSFSEQWSVGSGLFTANAMMLSAADHTYVRHLEAPPQPGEDWKIGLLHYAPDGEQLESLSAPTVHDPPPPGNYRLKPTIVWNRTADDAWLVGSNARYEFEVRSTDGATLRVQRVVEQAQVSDDEHAAYEDMRAWLNENQGQFMSAEMTETPRVKPFYRALYTGAEGRIWVYRYGPVEARTDLPEPVEGRPPAFPFEEAKVFDVFERDGTYLGEVIADHSINLHHVDLDAAWGTRAGDDGVTSVVRVRFVARDES